MSRRPSTGTLLGLVFLVVALGVLGYALMPFESAGGIECRAALLGSESKSKAERGYVVGREDEACGREGSGRLVTAGIAAVLGLTVGVGAVLVPEGQLERTLFGDEDER